MKKEKHIAWDIGGAHLKVASLRSDGKIEYVQQYKTPLWKGLDNLSDCIIDIIRKNHHNSCHHAITMTAELADIFPDRQTGVVELINLCKKYLGNNIRIYTFDKGFIECHDVEKYAHYIASANWHASSISVASLLDAGLFIDIGSTTTDIIPFKNKKLLNIGVDDHTRLQNDELLYTGIVRTPIMALASYINFRGKKQGLVSESFATTADVYRILNLLNEEDDLMESADGKAKDLKHSMIRLARMLGADASSTNDKYWYELASLFADLQLEKITSSIKTVISRALTKPNKIVGAGSGHFLARKISQRLDLPYMDFSELFDCPPKLRHLCNVCATSVSIANLHRLNMCQ